MTRLLSIILFFLLSSTVFAQTPADKAKGETSPEALAKRLTKSLSNDSLKVQVIFDWITSNVVYDTSIFGGSSNITSESQKAPRVMQTGKAVCQGYANLFYELCQASGIPVSVIEGYCRFSPENPKEYQLHAWNAVKVNGKWYVTDPTWGTGYIDMSKGGRYVREKNVAFFLTSPDKLLNTHLPFDPLWQFSYSPVSRDDFMSAAKKVANAPGKKTFSYPDTLQAYEKQDSATRRLMAFRRMHAFDPTNEEPKVKLSYHYNRLAISTMNKYSQTRSMLKTKEQLAGRRDELTELLNQAEAYFGNSLRFTEGISSKSFYFSNVTDNHQKIKSNLAVIKEERGFLKKNAN